MAKKIGVKSTGGAAIPGYKPISSALTASAVYQVLESQLLPHVREHGVSRVLLADGHIGEKDVPAPMSITRRGALGEGVRKSGPSLKILARWPEEEMEASRFPSLCFIYRGEADIPVGDCVVHCPAGSIILVPPGVPITEGRAAHWCRPFPEKAVSDIFWLQLRPFGAECHICHTNGCVHNSGGFGQHHLVAAREILHLGEQLIEELREKLPLVEIVGGNCLLSLVCLLIRHWKSEASEDNVSEEQADALNRRKLEDPASIVDRAQRYVDVHLGQPMTLQSIARGAYVSRVRLAEVFKNELDQTVWDYVTERRLMESKRLLTDTDAHIADIARLCGFKSATHFYQRFAAKVGTSPGEFRKIHRDRDSVKYL